MIIILSQRKCNIQANNITNNITRHNHNNYEHNVINMINEHFKRINNYDTENNYYNKKPFNTNNYNLYTGTFNFRMK